MSNYGESDSEEEPERVIMPTSILKRTDRSKPKSKGTIFEKLLMSNIIMSFIDHIRLLSVIMYHLIYR